MNKYRIYNKTNNDFFIMYLKDSGQARHFVINHLDLSLGWIIEQEEILTPTNN